MPTKQCSLNACVQRKQLPHVLTMSGIKAPACLHTQRGAISVVISALLGALALMVVAFSSLAINKAALDAPTRMTSEVNEALRQLQTWYEQQADAIAVSGAVVTEEQLQAVLTQRYPGMRLAMSSSMATPGCVSGSIACTPWRKIAAWYPATRPAASTTMQDGLPVSEFSGDAIWRVYSSQSWYYDRFSQAQEQLQRVASALTHWFVARKGIDPQSAQSTNYWRASDCAQPGMQMPCVDTYTPITTSGVAALLGLSSTEAVPALGSSIEISNLQDSSTTPPLSVALRISLPWGGTIRQTVLEP